jgi:hypothetical protein
VFDQFQQTDIATVIQWCRQHPRGTAGRDRSEQVVADPSEWMVAIVGMPTFLWNGGDTFTSRIADWCNDLIY